MINRLLQYLQAGLTVVYHNGRLLLVAVLLIVFPVFFLWVSQQFFSTAHLNITTSEKQRIQTIHSLLALRVAEDPSNWTRAEEMFTAVAADNPNLTSLYLIEASSSDQYVVRAGVGEALPEQATLSRVLRELPLAAEESSFIVPRFRGEARIWQVYRAIAGTDYYLYSEHNFSATDAVMSLRQQQSYLALSLIFVFLIGLAYWIYRQQDWARAHRALAAQLEERDQFTNLIAHELRAPLTAIGGYASFLAEAKGLSPDEHEYVAIIRQSTERLVRLVSDFLEVSRIQAGNLELEFTAVSLSTLLHEVARTQQSVATKKGLTLDVQAPHEEVLVETDTDRLTQVITNLVSNALKYTDQGAVTLQLHARPKAAVIKVMDTGRGMSADEQAQLFTPFVRFGSSAEQAKTTGTGLGMWITRQLVEQLGGTIGVESIAGQGTHIIITLPRER